MGAARKMRHADSQMSVVIHNILWERGPIRTKREVEEGGELSVKR
jgi:hypothetical protein